MRKRKLVVIGVLLLTAWRAAATALAAAAPPSRLWLASPVSGLAKATLVANSGDDRGRLFVAQLPGLVSIVKHGVLNKTPFLDISSLMTCNNGGLVAVAFSPRYATTGRFYVAYDDSGCNLVVARYRVSANPDRADPSSAQIVLSVPMAQPGVLGHAGCQLSFSPVDGDLYVSIGDGSNGGDPQQLAQNPATLLGKILRIDVETGSPVTYTVPPDNPFVGRTGYRPEIWALGVRNPFRLTFDQATGAMYVADVGEASWEEIDFAPPGDHGGENYGWPIMEGDHCFQASTCNQSGLTLPVWEYDHSGGNCAVIGGEVYRGRAIPALDGTYLYADLCTGNVWGLTDTGGTWTNQLLDTVSFSIVGFGADERGEVWITDFDGAIFALTAKQPAPVDRQLTLRSQATMLPGKLFTSTITVTSTAGKPATDVVVTDDLGPGFVVVKVTAAGATCRRPILSEAVCRLVTLPAGGIVTMSVVARATVPGSSVERAGVAANEPDPTPADDSAQVSHEALRLVSVTVSPNPVTGGSPATGTVVISGPAPAGGVTVGLGSSNTHVARVGQRAVIPAGATSQTFTVSTRQVTATTTVDITGHAAGSPPQGFTLTVNP